MQEFLLTLRMKLKEQMYTLRPEDNRCIYFKVTPVRSDLQVNIISNHRLNDNKHPQLLFLGRLNNYTKMKHKLLLKKDICRSLHRISNISVEEDF